MTLGYILYKGLSDHYFDWAYQHLKKNKIAAYNACLDRAMMYEDMANRAQ